MWWSKNPQRATARLGFCGTRSAEQALSIYRLLCAGLRFYIFSDFYFIFSYNLLLLFLYIHCLIILLLKRCFLVRDQEIFPYHLFHFLFFPIIFPMYLLGCYPLGFNKNIFSNPFVNFIQRSFFFIHPHLGIIFYIYIINSAIY
jgi:hypothetical protein